MSSSGIYSVPDSALRASHVLSAYRAFVGLGGDGVGSKSNPCPKMSPSPGNPAGENFRSCPERLCEPLKSPSREPALPPHPQVPGPSSFSPVGWDLTQSFSSHLTSSVPFSTAYASSPGFSSSLPSPPPLASTSRCHLLPEACLLHR